MNNLYNVHYTRSDTKQPSIGVVRTYYKGFSHTKEESTVHKRHNLIVDDCITDDAFEINPARITAASFDEANKFIEKAFKEAQKKAPKRFGIGSYFCINVADGWAYYMVTAIDRNHGECTVEWRGFGGEDCYHDHHFRSGGEFDIQDVKRYTAARCTVATRVSQSWNKIVTAQKRKSSK
ncbi:MAG: hypothetical protein IMZ61_07800 [Planctomycetes bacterium]|nr:hypothetical protein [Planctomycetota bacterium]